MPLSSAKKEELRSAGFSGEDVRQIDRTYTREELAEIEMFTPAQVRELGEARSELEKVMSGRGYPKTITWRDVQRTEGYEALRQEAAIQHGTEMLQDLSYTPSPEETAKLREAALFIIQERIIRDAPIFLTRRAPETPGPNDALTVCFRRPALIRVLDRKTKRRIDEQEKMSQPYCRDFTVKERQCMQDYMEPVEQGIIKPETSEECEKVKATFACANDLTVSEVAEAVDEDNRTVEQCMIGLMRQDNIVYSGESPLKEPRYRMPRHIVLGEKKLREVQGRIIVE